MGYSSDERNDAVSELVQGTLSFPVDRLGVRNPSTPFEEVRELTNSALLYDPDSVFFVINQAAKALGNTVSAEVEICNDLLSAIDELSMPNKPIEDVSSLSDASTALVNIQGALAKKGVIGASEYSRYTASINRAANDIGKTTKITHVPRGETQVIKDVSRSNSEAKAEVLLQFNSLKGEHSRLIERVGYILSSYDQFLASNLQGAVGQRQLSRASSDLKSLHDDLNSKTPMERTKTARSSLLKVLANKSVVKALKDRVLPGESRITQSPSGPSQYRLSPAGTGTPASITGTISAPWAIQSGVTDRLLGDYNNVTVSVDFVDGSDSGVVGIQQAQVEGNIEGDYAVHDDISTPYPLLSSLENYNVPTGGLFQIVVDGVLYECSLTAGAGRTALNIVTDFSVPGNWLTPPGVPPVTFSSIGGRITVVYNNGSPPTSYSERKMEIVKGYCATTDLWPWKANVPSVGLVTSDKSFGWDANNELWIQPNDYDDFTTNPIVATLPNGSFPDFLITPAQVKTAVDNAATASSEEFEGITIADIGGTRVGVASTWQRLVNGSVVGGGEGSTVTIRSEGLRGVGDPRAGLGTPSHLGMGTLGFSEDQESRSSDVGGQTVIKTLNQNSSFNAQAKASLVKNTYFESSEGIWNSGGVLRCLQNTDPTSGWPTASKLKVSIRSGGNRGVYGVLSYSWINIAGSDYLSLTLDHRMRSEEPSTGQHFEVYSEWLKLESTVDTTVSEIDINDPTIPANTARKVLGLSSSPQHGTVEKMLVEWNDPLVGWKPFDARTRKIKVGDKVLNSLGNEFTSVSSISELENGLIGVSPEVANWVVYSSFSIDSADYMAYSSFITDLNSWWDSFSFQENLNSLDLALNTVLRSHPNRDRVNAVYANVSVLRDALVGTGSLSEVIQNFSTRTVTSMKSAIKALSDRGLDRAKELLIQGQFEEFFNTTSRTASHGSNFLDAAATAVVQDLNENNAAKARFSSVYRRRAGEWTEDVDPTSDFSDTEEELPNDELEEFWPGVDEDIQHEY